MEIENQTINRIEKKVWQLILLAVVVILYLTLSLIGLQFFNFLGESDFIVFSKDSSKFSIVIGNAVNLARRLYTKTESGQVLITEKSLNRIHGTVSSAFVENISCKGVSDPVNVYKMA